MKHAYIYAVAVLCLAGCQTLDFILDPVPSLGRPRGVWNAADSTERHSVSTGPDPLEKALYLTAVEFPKGYDWQLDTLFGDSGARILLYRNGKKILSVPTGPRELVSPDPDMHHFLKGRLYTEYSDASRTYIGCDGQRLFSYEGREVLKGLMVKDSDVFTLGQDRSGEGISLRKNGELLFKRAGCLPCGDLFDVAYDPCGALYEDGAALCFGFIEPSSGRWFLYCAGSVQELAVPSGAARVFDVRRYGGKNYMVSVSGSAVSLSGSGSQCSFSLGEDSAYDHFRIVPGRSAPLFYGTVKNKYYNTYSTNYWSQEGLVASLNGCNNWMYDWDNYAYYIGFDYVAPLSIVSPDIPNPYFHEHNYVFSYRCGCLTDEGIAVALTPASGSAAPHIYTAVSDTPISINGFLTGLYRQ